MICEAGSAHDLRGREGALFLRRQRFRRSSAKRPKNVILRNKRKKVTHTFVVKGRRKAAAAGLAVFSTANYKKADKIF